MRELLLEVIALSGLTPYAAANKLGIKTQQMYMWTSPSAKRSIKYEKLVEVAEKLGVNVKISIELKNK